MSLKFTNCDFEDVWGQEGKIGEIIEMKKRNQKRKKGLCEK